MPLAGSLVSVHGRIQVSIDTVSNVMNGYGFIKAENRGRVEQALKATKCRPNAGARDSRRGRTGFTALIVPELDIWRAAAGHVNRLGPLDRIEPDGGRRVEQIATTPRGNRVGAFAAESRRIAAWLWSRDR